MSDISYWDCCNQTSMIYEHLQHTPATKAFIKLHAYVSSMPFLNKSKINTVQQILYMMLKSCTQYNIHIYTK